MSVCRTAEDLYQLVKSNQHIELSGDVSIEICTDSPSTSHSDELALVNYQTFLNKVINLPQLFIGS